MSGPGSSTSACRVTPVCMRQGISSPQGTLKGRSDRTEESRAIQVRTALCHTNVPDQAASLGTCAGIPLRVATIRKLALRGITLLGAGGKLSTWLPPGKTRRAHQISHCRENCFMVSTLDNSLWMNPFFRQHVWCLVRTLLDISCSISSACDV